MLRNEYSGITAIGTGSILQKGDTIEIGDMKIRLRIDDIKYANASVSVLGKALKKSEKYDTCLPQIPHSSAE